MFLRIGRSFELQKSGKITFRRGIQMPQRTDLTASPALLHNSQLYEEEEERSEMKREKCLLRMLLWPLGAGGNEGGSDSRN